MIDEMTLFQVEELCTYWHEHPPVHLLVAGFMGVKSEPRMQSYTPPEQPGEALPLPRMLATIPGLEPGSIDDLPPPIFDVAELMRMRP